MNRSTEHPEMRRFDFESDIYETLSCVPMAVRHKLDCAGIKITLQQWEALPLAQRRILCELPHQTQSQLSHLSELICQRIRECSGEQPSVLSSEQRHAAFPPSELRSRLADNAYALGFALSPERWTSLDDDERYALMKLGGGLRTKRNFGPALKEFLER
jgi:hypothetical protein